MMESIFKYLTKDSPQIIAEFISKPNIGRCGETQEFKLQLSNMGKYPITNFEIKVCQGQLVFVKSAKYLYQRGKTLQDLNKNTLIPNEKWIVDFSIDNFNDFNADELEIESESPLEIGLICNHNNNNVELKWKANLSLLTKLSGDFRLIAMVDKSTKMHVVFGILFFGCLGYTGLFMYETFIKHKFNNYINQTETSNHKKRENGVLQLDDKKEEANKYLENSNFYGKESHKDPGVVYIKNYAVGDKSRAGDNYVIQENGNILVESANNGTCGNCIYHIFIAPY